jgi:hypothetical protein
MVRRIASDPFSEVEWAVLKIVGKREASYDWNRVLYANSDNYLKDEKMGTYGNVRAHHGNLSRQGIRDARNITV